MTTSELESRILDGRVWTDFCEELKSLGALLDRPETPKDLQNRTLGFRYLTQLLRAGFEATVDFADPEFPGFYRLADETKKMLNDNPDNFYQNCALDPRFDYRIRGRRGTTRFLSFGTKGSSADAGAMVGTGDLDSSRMTFGPDGDFEIRVSCREQPGNWLPMTPQTRSMVVRQTFGDRAAERPAELSIECLGRERKYATPDPARLEASLRGALGFVRSTVAMNVDWMERYRKQHLNGLPEDDQALCQKAGGDPRVHYYQSYWKLAPDEALIVRFDDIPECETWNFQLSNYWMQSLDYRYHRISVNKFTAHYDTSGAVEIVVAHRDPGPRFPNWLDPCGHDQGGMIGRYVGAKRPPRALGAEVVPFRELANR